MNIQSILGDALHTKNEMPENAIRDKDEDTHKSPNALPGCVVILLNKFFIGSSYADNMSNIRTNSLYEGFEILSAQALSCRPTQIL